MEAATNALFDEIVELLDRDWFYYSNELELRCDQQVTIILQEEEHRLGGMQCLESCGTMYRSEFACSGPKPQRKKHVY